MKDPYRYDDFSVLKNKYGIRDQAELDLLESNKVTAKLMTLDELLNENTKTDFEYLKKINSHLFGDIYEFAGKNRTVWMERPEKILGGDSIRYCSPDQIENEGRSVILKMDSIEWNKLDLETCTKKYSKLVAALWQVHPFREGNTRSVMAFAGHYALNHGFSMNRQLFKQYSQFTRDALVKASDGMYADTQYIEKIVKDAILQGDTTYFKRQLSNAGFLPEEKLVTAMKNMNRHFGRNVSVKEIYAISKGQGKLNEAGKELVKAISDSFKNQEIKQKGIEKHPNFLER